MNKELSTDQVAVKQCFHHGELNFLRLPEGDLQEVLGKVGMKLKGMKSLSEGHGPRFILSHSETGHHHVLEGDFDVLELDTSTIDKAYGPRVVKVGAGGAKLSHTKEGDIKHETINLSPNITHLVTTHAEYTPEGLRRVAD